MVIAEANGNPVGVKNPSTRHRWWYQQKKAPKVFFFFVIFLMTLVSYIYHTSEKRGHFPTPSTHTFSPMPTPKQTTPMFPYLIEEDRKCANGPPFLLLLIPSRPQDSHTRNALRKTWANETLVNGINITRLFLLGRPINSETQENVTQESSMFHDIIQQDFIDSYNNLTLKTLMGIEWVSRLCPKVKYVMKVDTDMFFNPWFLVEKVLQPKTPPKVNFYTGLVVIGGPPKRDKNSKWYISYTAYSKDIYPPYCSGTGYLFSGDLAQRIYMEANGLHIFPFEDVFVGMCLENIGVKIYKPAGQWFIGERIEYNRCQFAKVVTVHRFPPNELLKLWPDFIAAVETCSWR